MDKDNDLNKIISISDIQRNHADDLKSNQPSNNSNSNDINTNDNTENIDFIFNQKAYGEFESDHSYANISDINDSSGDNNRGLSDIQSTKFNGYGNDRRYRFKSKIKNQSDSIKSMNGKLQRFRSNSQEHSYEIINEDKNSAKRNNEKSKMKNIQDSNRNNEIQYSTHDERILIELYNLRSKYRNNISYSAEIQKFKSQLGSQQTKTYLNNFETKFNIRQASNNQFIPEIQDLVSQSDNKPDSVQNFDIQLMQGDLQKIQYLMTSQFSKYIVRIRVQYEIDLDSIDNQIYQSIILSNIKKKFNNNEIINNIMSAGQTININSRQSRLSFVLTGFNHKINEVEDYIFSTIKNIINKPLTVSEQETLQNKFRQKLILNQMITGKHHSAILKINMHRIMTIGKYDPLKVLTQINAIKSGKVKSSLNNYACNNFASSFTSIVKNKKLIIIGDTNIEILKSIETSIIANFLSFNNNSNELSTIQPVRIRDLRNLDHKKANLLNKYSKAQNVILNVCMFGLQSYTQDANLTLLINLIHPYLFNQLRSERSIGQKVKSKKKIIENVLINEILIAGKKFTPFKMHEMLIESMKEFKHQLTNMPNDAFEVKRENSYASISDGLDSIEKFENLIQSEVKHGTYDQKRRQKVKEQVQNTTKEQLVAFLKDLNERSQTLLFQPKKYISEYSKAKKEEIKSETLKFFKEVQSKQLIKTNEDDINVNEYLSNTVDEDYESPEEQSHNL